MTEEFYQISIIISGKLLSYTVEDSNYNKYKTGTGKLLINDGENAQIFPITAGKELTDKLLNLVGQTVELTGAVRNYRRNDEKYNVIRVYSIEAVETDTDVNSVQATCEVIGLMTKPSLHANSSAKAAQLYLLTNEKYDKHTRLNAVIFGSATTPLSLEQLPALGKLYNFKGYLQLDRANQYTVELDNCISKTANEGKFELVVTHHEEAGYDSTESNDN